MKEDKRRNNSGVLFINDRKEKPNHKDRTGSCTIDGKDYWIDGWIHVKDNSQYLSLEFTPKVLDDGSF